MIKKILSGLCFLASASVILASTSIEGSDKKVIEITPDTSTGLDRIFVVYDAEGCNFHVSDINGYQALIYKYSNLGGGYAEELRDLDRNSTFVAFPLSKEDMGYIVEDGSKRYYYWVVNYANHMMILDSVDAAEDQECDYSVLNISGEASAITYYTINGQPRTLTREIYVDYTTQEFDNEISDFVNKDERKVYESILGLTLKVSPPAYCSTYFIVSGDRFLREWGMEQIKETSLVQPVAVDCRTEAEQEYASSDEPSNIMKGDDSGLGGSAPATIYFYALTTDGIIHNEWQMSRDKDFINPEYRFYQKDIDYIFSEEGTYYLRYIGSNAEGTCETYSDVYTVNIGSSALECPNAFSPNGDGVNDEWRVSYRSLIDFHCEIFNRNGQKIIGFDDPSKGWDGTWHGKKVKPGVYYYVIVATGADGEKYKKSGDINIINSIDYGSTAPPSPEE